MKHIRTKLNATYIGLTVLVLFIAGFIIDIELDAYFHHWLASDLERRADLILDAVQQNSGTSPERIKTLAHSAGARITLITEDGRIVLDSEVPQEKIPKLENHLARPEIQAALRFGSGTDIRKSATVGVDYFYMAKRIRHSPEDAPGASAFIRLSVPLTEVREISHGIRTDIIIAGMIVLVIVVIVSTFVSHRIVSPLVHIAGVAAAIRGGNLDTRIDIASADEIGQVAHAVNEMVDRLKTDIVQLRKLEQVRSQFLGNVSHELRTPIFALQGFLETLLDGAIDDPNVNKDFVEKAYSNAMRLNTLLNDLIDISRIESGEMKMSFRYFNVNDFVDSVLVDLESMAGAKDIRLTARYETDVSQQVLGDRDRLVQALSNLIDNAVKYTQRGGTVTVQTRIEGEHVRIEVADTGIGISPEHLPRIFERFYRVDKERSREAGGTGLGLAIVKHIIEAHGGKVEVRSEVGKGSVFSFPVKK
jgi:two-component system phosphate regulon sensor histidine kinase PhoR